MLKNLFEAIDKNVLTDDLKESLEVQFNEAVEAMALSKSEELAAEKISEAIEEMTEKVSALEAEQTAKINEAKAELEKEFATELENILESVDNYIDKAIEEFIVEARAHLDEAVKTEKADLIIESFEAMIVATGVDVAKIVEAKEADDVETKLAESVEKYDALMNEFIEKEKEIDSLMKAGVISEMKAGLTLVESEKFEKLADQIEFSKDSSYVEKLDVIKESLKTSKVEEISPVVEAVVSPAIDKRFI